MSELRTVWVRGEKTELARRLNMNPNYLLGILAGDRNVSARVALRIEQEAAGMGLFLGRLDVLFPEESENPLLNTKGAASDGHR